MRKLIPLRLLVASLFLGLPALGVGCDDTSESVPAGVPAAPGVPWQPAPQSPGPSAKACYGPLEAGLPLPPEPDPAPEGAELVEDAAAADASSETAGAETADAADAASDATGDADASMDTTLDVTDGDAALADEGGARDAPPDGIADAEAGDAGPEVCPTCPGEDFPAYAAGDFQPQSCSYRRAYGLEAFKGRPTVAVLLAAW